MNDAPFFFSLKSWFVIFLVVLIAWGDLWRYRISNRSVVLTLLLGLAWNTSSHLLSGATLGLLGILVGFGLLVPFYALGGLTAGDVKWLSALGAWYGPRGILGVFLLSSILLGVFCLVLIALRYIRMFRRTPGRVAIPTQTSAGIDDALRSEDRRLVLIPYAVPVAIGVLMIESYRAMGA
jgi:prepilin peptidase CpaA